MLACTVDRWHTFSSRELQGHADGACWVRAQKRSALTPHSAEEDLETLLAQSSAVEAATIAVRGGQQPQHRAQQQQQPGSAGQGPGSRPPSAANTAGGRGRWGQRLRAVARAAPGRQRRGRERRGAGGAAAAAASVGPAAWAGGPRGARGGDGRGRGAAAGGPRAWRYLAGRPLEPCCVATMFICTQVLRQ